MTPQQQALSIIRGEHRTLAAVINALEHVAADMAAGKLTPDYKLLWSILYYIEEFPERLHHPKEDSVLFPRIRAHTHDIDAVLDELGRQHVSSRPHLDNLKTVLGHMQADIAGAVPEFADKVATYASFHWKHMNQEETMVLPKAIETFSLEDWSEVATSFAENKDPLQDGSTQNSEWFRQFYRRIVTLVPEPWGVGERR
ncbi:MAG: hemerythrin domain-containing protein [Pseudomonadota bacterium]|nr:hemerythrin domain-containing protein [Pseudomonadota bacterium]